MINVIKNSLTKFNICDLLIIFLIIAVLVSNYLWLKIDEYPAEGHGLMGIVPAVQVYRELIGIKDTHKLYDKILGLYNGPGIAYPPLSFLIVVLFYFLFGLQGQMVVMVNSLYIAVTLICVYLIGKNIFNACIGLLAAFILSSFLGFIDFSRVYWIEFGLMAYVCLDIYLLLKTDFFENRKYSIFLGIALALSFLHKYEFIPFVIGPLMLVIYKSAVLKDILKLKWSNKLANLILTLVLALGLTSFWWVKYGKILLNRLNLVLTHIDPLHEKIHYLKNILSFESLTYYLVIIRFIIWSPFFYLFFLSMAFIIIITILKKKKRFYILFFILYFAISYLIFTLLLTKSLSHMLSILPSMAILISAGIYLIKNRVFKITLTSLIVAYGSILHAHSFYPIININAFNRFALKCPYDYSDYDFSHFNPPRKERLESTIRETLQYIKADSLGKVNSEVYVVPSRKKVFRGCTFEYYRLLGSYPISSFFSFKTTTDISKYNYIIIESAEGESYAKMPFRDYPDREGEIYKKILLRDMSQDFDLIKVYKIPNGKTSVLIYKRKTNL